MNIPLAEWPFVSIIIVNYNGKRFLDECLTALRQQTYPAHRFEVVLVDNRSSDDSVEFTKKNYPWVKLIQAPRNLGFAGGNNLGVRQTQSSYVAFLNNDTHVEPDWLQTLVTAGESDPTIGGVCPKLLLYDDYFNLELRVAYDSLPEKIEFQKTAKVARHVKSWLRIYGIRTATGREAEYLPGFSEKRQDETKNHYYEVENGASFRLPALPPGEPVVFTFEAALTQPILPSPILSIYLGEECLGKHPLSTQLQKIEATIPPTALAKPVSLIQNAGVIVFGNGMGRDRGTFSHHAHNYEEDRGQYDQTEEVFAACGASLLCRRAMLEDVGLFDEHFFMYYEDVDLSWRARLRGWKILYTSTSSGRHIHMGSSSEWKAHHFYTRIERNRLAMLLKNATTRRWFKEWSQYGWSIIWMTLWLSKDTYLRRYRHLGPYWEQVKIRCKVILALFPWLPRLILQRWQIWRSRRVSPEKVESWLVEERPS